MTSGWKRAGEHSLLDGTAAADDRTLALASPGLTAEKLEVYVQYQQAFLEAFEGTQGTSAAARMAAAENVALSALPEPFRKENPRVGALVSSFCSQRWTLSVLRQKLAERAEPTSELEQERQRKLQEEIASLSEMASFKRRHGAEAVRLLLGREEELLALHQRQRAVLTQG